MLKSSKILEQKCIHCLHSTKKDGIGQLSRGNPRWLTFKTWNNSKYQIQKIIILFDEPSYMDVPIKSSLSSLFCSNLGYWLKLNTKLTVIIDLTLCMLILNGSLIVKRKWLNQRLIDFQLCPKQLGKTCNPKKLSEGVD